MCGKIITILLVIVAVVLALAANLLPSDKVEYVIVVSRFFDIMLPVLGVAALLKYLCSCPMKKGCCNATEDKHIH